MYIIWTTLRVYQLDNPPTIDIIWTTLRCISYGQPFEYCSGHTPINNIIGQPFEQSSQETTPCTHTVLCNVTVHMNAIMPYCGTQIPGSTMGKISEISNSQSRPIRSTLALPPREEHPYRDSLKALTSKPNSITQDATTNVYDASNLTLL